MKTESNEMEKKLSNEEVEGVTGGAHLEERRGSVVGAPTIVVGEEVLPSEAFPILIGPSGSGNTRCDCGKNKDCPLCHGTGYYMYKS